MATATIMNDSTRIHIPEWVSSLKDFRRWADMPAFPEDGRICFLEGEVWLDMSKEQIFSHVQVKTEFNRVLAGLAKSTSPGLYLADGVLLVNIVADIAVKPDGTFIAQESLLHDRVRFIEGKQEGFVELEGTPDMVLEVVSASSIRKDNVVLHEAYWKAGISEYWLVDARKGPVRFDIWRHTSRGYVATKKKAGWLPSKVFGREFQLRQRTGVVGHPEHTLHVR